VYNVVLKSCVRFIEIIPCRRLAEGNADNICDQQHQTQHSGDLRLNGYLVVQCWMWTAGKCDGRPPRKAIYLSAGVFQHAHEVGNHTVRVYPVKFWDLMHHVHRLDTHSSRDSGDRSNPTLSSSSFISATPSLSHIIASLTSRRTSAVSFAQASARTSRWIFI